MNTQPWSEACVTSIDLSARVNKCGSISQDLVFFWIPIPILIISYSNSTPLHIGLELDSSRQIALCLLSFGYGYYCIVCSWRLHYRIATSDSQAYLDTHRPYIILCCIETIDFTFQSQRPNHRSLIVL